jgi:pilus assembly protein CpaB
MGRRTVLLIVAALIAALGTGMVFLYVRGADNRAAADQQPVQVLKAVAQINAGETLAAAQAAGKVALGTVPKAQLLTGAVNSTSGIGERVALSAIYPNEQIITGKFGSAGDQETLTIPDGAIATSVTLTDTGRVAGFVAPGAHVAVFLTTNGDDNLPDATRLLLPKAQVIAVGATTVISTTEPDTEAAAESGDTTEAPPQTLVTLALSQAEAQKVAFAASRGELSFGLLNDKSKVQPDAGADFKNLFR